MVRDNSHTEVFLVSYTPDLERLCASAMRSCYSEKPSHELYLSTDFNDDQVKRMLRKAVEAGHLSVIEHASLTFSISGVSRVLTHQLVRHRLASYSQQSQRHVRLKGEKWYLKPPSIQDSAFDAFMDDVNKYYNFLLLRGIPKEDARLILPNATLTHITMTANPRELRRIFSLRCDTAAQWEIRDVCWIMLGLSLLVAPNIFSTLDPPAVLSKDVLSRLEKLTAEVNEQRNEFNKLVRGSLFKLRTSVDLEHPVTGCAIKCV